MVFSVGTSLLVTLLAFFLRSAPVSAVPTPQTLGSGLSILTHNDLYGASSPRQTAVIVLDASRTYQEAERSCSALGEELWNPESTPTDFSFLRYLDYNKSTDDLGTYHIAGRDGNCRAISTDGNIQNPDCQSVFPALCSQSAPLSDLATSDIAARWQTAVVSGQQTFVGYRDKHSFRFLGIRYAPQPPRFSHTKYTPSTKPSNVSALLYGPQCIQSGCNLQKCSEDCHFLNIWTPYLPLKDEDPKKEPKSKLKPVMLWIHGGGFTSGTGSDTTFDGSALASRGDTLLVTLNYRLGTLGFLALSNSTISGNYGLVDQLTALTWLRNHIRDFGGDPERITVFGQSAGAASVRALLAIMMGRKDFGKVKGAVMMSNPDGLVYAGTFSQYYSIPEASALNRGVLNETRCYNRDQAAQLHCLRNLPALKFLEGTVARYPVIDGTYLKSNLHLKGEKKLDIPILMGIMRDDGAPFSKLLPTTNVSQALDQLSFNATQIVGSNLFPLPSGTNGTLSVFNVTARVTTDGEFRCLGQATVAAAVENSVFPKVYSYEIHRGYQIVEWSPNPPTCLAPVTATHPYGDPSQEYYKCHSGELYYVFGTLIRQGRPPRDEFDIPFSQYLVDTWTSFARTQDPNPDPVFLSLRGYSNTSDIINSVDNWAPSSSGKPVVRILNTEVKDVGFRELEQCNALGLPVNYYSR